jgi:hypothetical protein
MPSVNGRFYKNGMRGDFVLMKENVLTVPLLMILAVLPAACGFENQADIDAIRESGKEISFSSPLMDVNFRPAGIKVCCEYNSNPASLLIDGKLDAYYDWGYGNTTTTKRSDYFYPESAGTEANAGNGHASGYTNRLTPDPQTGYGAHFFTVDLGEIKTNIWRIHYMGREMNPGTTDDRVPTSWEVWVSKYPISEAPPSAVVSENHEGLWGSYSYPEAPVLAAKGTWPAQVPVTQWRTIDFTQEHEAGAVNENGLIGEARYIQYRQLTDNNTGNTLQFGGREIKIDALGSFSGKLYKTKLGEAYARGSQMLSSVHSTANKVKLDRLLNGVYNSDGTLYEKGARQLFDESVSVSASLAERAEIQILIDAKVKELLAFFEILALEG